MYRNFLVLVLLTISGWNSVYALTAEEAYKAIPHRRTVFDDRDSALTRIQAAELKSLFQFSDAATVLRVEGLNDIRNKDGLGLQAVVRSYQLLIADYSHQSTIPEMENIKLMFLRAVQLHQKFYENKLLEHVSTGTYNANFTTEVNQSSQLLQQAYGLLMSQYAHSTPGNKDAYYDYPCALDFQ